MRKIFSVIIFCSVIIYLIFLINPLFVDKSFNRYYMLSKELENIKEIDVQVYGSCHAYTSFDSQKFTNETGLYAYNMSNPSEIIPVTYLRIKERLKKDIPEIVIVEIWGVNAYDTYIDKNKIFEEYMKLNIENIPISLYKQSVIRKYDTLNYIEDNFYIAKYKERLVEFSINELDFNYSFELASLKGENTVYEWLFDEMKNRFSHNGFLSNLSNPIMDYPEKQAKIKDDETLPVEEDLMFYVEEIIRLCEKNDIPIIFYRAPYRSNENELRKANYLRCFFSEKGIPFYDLEKEVEYNYKTDFLDYEHLSKIGAQKSTDFLTEKILAQLN